MRQLLTDLRGNPIYSHGGHRQRIRRGGGGGVATSPSYSSARYHPSYLNTRFFNTLICLVHNRSWDDVVRRCSSHPHEIVATDDITGNTPLHVACRFDPPPRVVRALRAASRTRNHEGAAPLHVAACHRCSADAIRALIECGSSSPTSASPPSSKTENPPGRKAPPPVASLDGGGADDEYEGDRASGGSSSPTADLSRMGRAPIHYACLSFRGINIDAFKVLLEATLKTGDITLNEQDKKCPFGLDDYIDEEFEVDDFAEEDFQRDFQGNDDDDENEKAGYICGLETGDRRDEERDRKMAAAVGATDAVQDDRDDHDDPVVINVMSLRDATGQTPLGLLFRRYRERVRCVISTVDRVRAETSSSHSPSPDRHDGGGDGDASSAEDRAALAAALVVHADLGELWEKARWIVARLTEERLHRERKKTPSRRGGHGRDDRPHQGEDDDDDLDRMVASWTAEQRRLNNNHNNNGAVVVEPGRREEDANIIFGTRSEGADLRESQRQEAHESSSSSSQGDGHFRIVHASVALTGYGCPPEMIRLAVSIHPHQVREMDEDGNLPLHIAATASSFMATADQASPGQFIAAAAAAAAASLDTPDDASIISDAAMSFFSSATVSQTSNPFDKVIKILLRHHPEGARVPHGRTGRLPLICAIDAGLRTWDDGIRSLLYAHPPALHNRRAMAQDLFPDVLSLVGGCGHGCYRAATGRTMFDDDDDYFHQGLSSLSSPPSSTHGGTGPPHVRNAATATATPMTRGQRTRRETAARSTIFELLRTKPHWVVDAGHKKKKKNDGEEATAARGTVAKNGLRDPTGRIANLGGTGRK